jgi:23S rRNA pseudouridine955/2504/2580 synthase
VNKGRAAADTRLAAGDRGARAAVRVAARAEPAAGRAAARVPDPVRGRDPIAIDKPSGTAVPRRLGRELRRDRAAARARPEARFLELVHRLDRETSGILLLAKKRSALVALQEQFRARETGKTYAASSSGVGRRPEGDRRRAPPHRGRRGRAPRARGRRRPRRGQRAISLVRIVHSFAAATLLDVTIKTGRTHQIRVHLAHSGHVIVGDDKYGDFALNRRYARGEAVPGVRFERMFLHARRLAFDHPATGERIELDSALPPECARLVEALAPAH